MSYGGNAYCWGFPLNGRLGDGTTSTNKTVPQRVHAGEAVTEDTDSGHLTNIAQILASGDHTCAISNEGNAYCWGNPVNGKLGDETTSTDKTTPQRVHAGEAVTEDTDSGHLTNIAQISTGANHTCAISNEGNAYCWGSPTNGRLGDDTTSTNKTAPQRVHAGEAVTEDTDSGHLTNIAQISAGGDHTCAISNEGNAYCWGSPFYGHLGDGTTSTNKTAPQRVHAGEAVSTDSDGSHLVNITQITAGGLHSCAVSNAGNAYCWGDPSSGKLGDGTSSTNKTVPQRVHAGEAVTEDTDSGHLTNIAQISAGACAVSNEGIVYCWGPNLGGQNTPVRTLRGASTESGTFTVLGSGNFGGNSNWSFYNLVFGDGVETEDTTTTGSGTVTVTNTLTVSQNHTLNAGSKTWILSGSGTPFSALGTFTPQTSTVEFTATTTGNSINSYGNTFNNLSFNGEGGEWTSTEVTLVEGNLTITAGTFNGMDNWTVEGDVTGNGTLIFSEGMYLANILQVSAGRYHTCAVSYEGNVYCWGSSSNGQLGNSSTSERTTPFRVQDGEAVSVGTDNENGYLSNIAQISAGVDHTCAISNGGNAYCWGNPANGRLGDGTTSTNKTTPQRVHAGEAVTEDTESGHLTNIAQILAGNGYSCAVSNASNVYCWGANTFGVLGDNSTSQRTTPVRVHAGEAVAEDQDSSRLTNITYISTGAYHTCAISNGGNAYCWGRPTNGRLGDGTTSTNKTTPQRVHAGEAVGADEDSGHLTNIIQISAGGDHTCAISNGGNAYCWGYNGLGVLGDNSTTERTAPIRTHSGEAVTEDTDSGRLVNIAQISAGYNHTCAVSQEGNTYCWGYNSTGQLGDDSTTQRNTPVRIHAGDAFTEDTNSNNLANIAQISTGDAYTCAVSNEKGNAYCWGLPQNGKLGNGTTSGDQTTPINVLRGQGNGSQITTTIKGSGNFGGNGNWSFYNLVLGDGVSTTTTTMQGSGNINIGDILSIEGNHTLNAGSKIINLNTMTIDGTFSASTSTINYNGTNNTPIAPATYHNLGVGTTSNSTATTYTLTDDTEVTGLLTVGNDASSANDTLDIGSNTLTLSGGGIDATTWGVFDADSGTTEYTGTENQTIAPATYLNLSVTTDTARTATFISGETYTIPENGTVTFTGSSGQLLTLAPNSASVWDFNVDDTDTTVTVEYVSVSYSDASGGIEIDAENGANIDGGNNINWKFPPFPTKVVFTNTPHSFTVGTCNGLAKAFTIQLQDGGNTAGNPTDTTVIRISSNSPSYTIYSDSDCTSEATNGDFTFTTEEHTKSVYIIDQNVALINRTLTATRQSGDTLTSGTQDYTVTEVPTEVRIKGNLRIEGDMRFR